LRLHAAEKYLLGELAPEVREQFEEHYFECEACANDVKAGAAFIDGARVLFKEKCSGLPRISGRL
jgi:anti-sigma factor RsiW